MKEACEFLLVVTAGLQVGIADAFVVILSHVSSILMAILSENKKITEDDNDAETN